MKNYYSFLFFICFLTFGKIVIYSNQLPNCNSSLNWDEPRTHTICLDTLMDINNPCYNDAFNCCVEVIYYERLNTDLQPPRFQIHISNIILLNPSECLSCFDYSFILSDFFDILVKMKSYNDPSFYQLLLNTERDNDGNFILEQVFNDKGRCNMGQTDTTRCDYDVRCCRKEFIAYFETDSLPPDVSAGGQFINTQVVYPNCIDPCIAVCEGMKLNPIIHPDSANYMCNPDCDYSQWDTLTITYIPKKCPNCIFYISALRRNSIYQSPWCQPNLTEIRIIDVTLSQPCFPCDTNETEVMREAIVGVLQYFENELEVDKCRTELKITTAPCWYALGNHYSSCVGFDGCCWALYEICKRKDSNNYDYYTYEIIRRSNSIVDCQAPHALCEFICNDFPNYIIFYK